MDRNLEKLVDLLERDREIFQLLRQCPYEILRHFEVRDYDDDQFVLSQGEIHNKFYIIASGYVDIYVESSHGKLQTAISSEILSQQMAVTTRSVNRILKQLKEQGIIELEKGKIVICDFEALKDAELKK